MSRPTRILAYGGACVALALGGAAISSAASKSSKSSSSSSSSAAQTQPAPPNGYGGPPKGGRPGGPGGRHIGANGKQEQALTGATAAKVKAAAEAKVAGGTVERTETDVDTGSPYEAHMTKSDGSEVVVYVDKDFNVTSVASMQHP